MSWLQKVSFVLYVKNITNSSILKLVFRIHCTVPTKASVTNPSNGEIFIAFTVCLTDLMH